MPLYEFECERCGKHREEFVKVGTEILSCQCGGPMKKIMSMTNFALKGPGWASSGYSYSPSSRGDKNGS